MRSDLLYFENPDMPLVDRIMYAREMYRTAYGFLPVRVLVHPSFFTTISERQAAEFEIGMDVGESNNLLPHHLLLIG